MQDGSAEELEEIMRPIASLISKSEKAREKVAPGTWQHTMLTDNVKALRIGMALLTEASHGTDAFTREDLREASRAFDSMIGRTEKAGAKFAPGTSQHTLQRNRLAALREAALTIREALEAQGDARP